MDITGIILAGGKSTRMGEDKGLALLNGKPMIAQIIDSLEKITPNIILITSNTEYDRFGYPRYSDIIPEKGPVGGIYTGLHHTKTEVNICISCDTPFVSSTFLNWLISKSNESSITIPSYKGKTHQLIGIYNKSLLKSFENKLNNNTLRLKDVILSLDHKIVQVENHLEKGSFTKSIFENINTKTELNKLQTMTKVNYFGIIADLIGSHEEHINFNALEEIKLDQYFENKYPEIKNIKYQIAVNQSISNNSKSTDKLTEIALLPPFAGG